MIKSKITNPNKMSMILFVAISIFFAENKNLADIIFSYRRNEY